MGDSGGRKRPLQLPHARPVLDVRGIAPNRDLTFLRARRVRVGRRRESERGVLLLLDAVGRLGVRHDRADIELARLKSRLERHGDPGVGVYLVPHGQDQLPALAERERDVGQLDEQLPLARVLLVRDPMIPLHRDLIVVHGDARGSHVFECTTLRPPAWVRVLAARRRGLVAPGEELRQIVTQRPAERLCVEH